MDTLWGIHNDQPDLDLIGGEFVSIGWHQLGDLHPYEGARDLLKKALVDAFPEAKAGAIPVWAGVLHRFAFEMNIGDLVIAPNKADRTLSFGRIESDYYWDSDADVHPNRRRVTWLATGVPRVLFSQAARNEIGSAVTLFRVKRYAHEFLDYLKLPTGKPLDVTVPTPSDDAAIESAEEEPNAERIQTYTSDFLIESLHKLNPYRFEHFTAALLRAMGYRAQATQASGDGGVDVIAYRDPLGLEPPIIKVQCKRTIGTVGAPEVQKLAGALALGGSEVGLFITLGSYSADAIHIERIRQDLRLVTGTGLVSLILAHYEDLEPEWRRLIPMRQVYVVDREPEVS